ncbi:hypothetical protein F4824DRAFT_496400 [Ustulina deusta]|nr:hypothetical protein F4823DRAFT_557947 [Ustulina deusta]KAI3341648.1 hypothetical protein F4824DRAFT_496400 [Ustulina deusta]
MASKMLCTAVRPAVSFAVIRQPVMAQRSFIGSTPSLKHKESNGNGADPEKHKQDLLAKHKSGKGHWKPELASDSEEAVKADRTSYEDVTTMQNRTKATAEETSKTGTSMRDGL